MHHRETNDPSTLKTAFVLELKRSGASASEIAAALGEYMRACGGVTLDLSGYRRFDDERHKPPPRLAEEDVIRLLGVLESNTTITSLVIDECDLGHKTGVAIGRLLERNTMLLDINVSRNHIGDQGVAAIAASLSKNKTCADLHMNRNRIGDQGATALAQALTQNVTLHYLHMNGNSIGDRGATALAGALAKNTTLKYISLLSYDGAITSDGLAALAEAVDANPSLERQLRVRGPAKKDVIEEIDLWRTTPEVRSAMRAKRKLN